MLHRPFLKGICIEVQDSETSVWNIETFHMFAVAFLCFRDLNRPCESLVKQHLKLIHLVYLVCVRVICIRHSFSVHAQSQLQSANNDNHTEQEHILVESDKALHIRTMLKQSGRRVPKTQSAKHNNQSTVVVFGCIVVIENNTRSSCSGITRGAEEMASSLTCRII